MTEIAENLENVVRAAPPMRAIARPSSPEELMERVEAKTQRRWSPSTTLREFLIKVADDMVAGVDGRLQQPDAYKVWAQVKFAPVPEIKVSCQFDGDSDSQATREVIQNIQSLLAQEAARALHRNVGHLINEIYATRAERLHQSGFTASALDLIYDETDALLRHGKFALLDSVLVDLSVDSMSAEILIALLTATLPAKSKLASRREFFQRVSESLARRGILEQGLLSGLES